MRLHLKVIAASISAALVVSAIPAPAAAQQQQQRQSILPTALGPIGAAALFPTTNTFFWTTSHPWSYTKFGIKFAWKPINLPGWQNIGQNLQNLQWNVHKAADAIKVGKSLHAKGYTVYVNGTKITNLNDLHNIGHSSLKDGVKIEGEKSGVKTKNHSRSSNNVGKAVVGCIFGSALGAITSAVRKGNALGNPLRWRSQAEHEKILASGYEKQFELTNAEAHTATAFCGLGSFTLNWQQRP
jgi:hypothetical protein